MSDASAVSTMHGNEVLLFYTLLQLGIIVLAGRAGGLLARRVGQSAAVGEIVMGILLGPSLFGWLAPATFALVFHSASSEPLTILSNLGLVLLMFQIGLEFDFAHLRERRNRLAVWQVSTACLLLPLACGFAMGWYLSAASTTTQRFDTACFVATAFAITALPILGRILIEFDLSRTRLGVIAISSAAVNDVVGWLLLALITALTISEFDPARFALRLVGVLAFALACGLLLRPALKRLLRSTARAAPLSANLLGIMLCLIFLAAMVTSALGIFAIFGGFMLGVTLYDELEFAAAWRSRVGEFVNVFFLPIFFTYTGLRTSVGSLQSLGDWSWCIGIVAAASASKLTAGYVSARLSGFDHPQASIMGFMMNTRALMELIVINIGLDLGVISPKLFTMLVVMAVFSTVITTPALRHFMPRAQLVPQRA